MALGASRLITELRRVSKQLTWGSAGMACATAGASCLITESGEGQREAHLRMRRGGSALAAVPICVASAAYLSTRAVSS